MSHQPQELLVTPRFRVVRYAHPGRDGQLHTRDIIHHPGAVTILPMIDDDHVCLIRNRRVAVGKTLIELPAGTLDAGEDPRHTAERELIEETGYRAARIEKLCEFYMSPGVLDERMYLFLAEGLTAGATELEATEEIETLVVAWDEALDLVLRNEIQDSKSMVGILYYDRIRKQKQREN